ncbi:MAG: transketolase family protein [Lachnospiraceae bacterium]|nr:transketolase family protein [Lachnospiraceae bacterium]
MSKSYLRNIIGEYMTVLGTADERVVVVNADLSGTCRNKEFVERFPKRSFNSGIAEQNMVSFAAGLACEGFVPYAFSMAPFLTMRACEQVRTDVAYGNRDVRLIGVYAGLSGGISGATHWGIEDVGIITSMPGITVFEVSDAALARRILDYSLKHKGPIYIRCGVEPTEDIYNDDISVNPGSSLCLREGNEGAILCSGVTVQYALEASEQILKKTGEHVRVVDMYSIKPIDRQAVISAAKTGRVVVAQDHNVIGGLGSIVGTVIAEEGISTSFKILGLNDEFVPMAHAPYLYRLMHLDSEGIADSFLTLERK